MYYTIVVALMLVLPATGVAVETAFFDAPLGAALIGKWFVFCAVGLRLFSAGVKQIAQPAYTAREILGIRSDDALILVRELGFANVAIGIVGVVSLFAPTWRNAAALSGVVFYGLAGLSHLFQGHRNRLENVAMVTDLFAATVLFAVFVAAIRA